MIETLRILGKAYVIEWVEGDKDSTDYGECFHDHCRIQVATFQCDQQRHDTLLHEILHAVDHEMHCALSEAQVRRMATGIYAVLRDNPALVAYLTGE